MKIEDWIEIKFNLQNIPPSTRINYLRDIFNSLDKKKDKEIINDIIELIKEAQFEIEEQRTIGERVRPAQTATATTSAETVEELTVAPETSLEEKLAASSPKEKTKQTDYGVKLEKPKSIDELYSQLKEFKQEGYIPKQETLYGIKKELEYAHKKVTTQEERERVLRSESLLREMEGTADHALNEIKKYKHGI